jgi:hypothetical protein
MIRGCLKLPWADGHLRVNLVCCNSAEPNCRECLVNLVLCSSAGKEYTAGETPLYNHNQKKEAAI